MIQDEELLVHYNSTGFHRLHSNHDPDKLSETTYDNFIRTLSSSQNKENPTQNITKKMNPRIRFRQTLSIIFENFHLHLHSYQ